MERWLYGLTWILLAVVGWPSARVQATSLATMTWLLRLGLGLLIAGGATLSLAPEWTQQLAPDVAPLATGLGDIWATLPTGTKWLITAIGLLAVGLPVIAILDFARDVTLLHDARRRSRPLRETFTGTANPASNRGIEGPPGSYPASRSEDVEQALNALRRFPGTVTPPASDRRPLADALRGP